MLIEDADVMETKDANRTEQRQIHLRVEFEILSHPCVEDNFVGYISIHSHCRASLEPELRHQASWLA